MKMTPNLTEALELAKTDRFSGARLRALKALYDSADASEKPYIGELFEVFASLIETPEQLEALSAVRE